MISLLSDSFKVDSEYTRPIERLIEDYFNCTYGYIVEDNYDKYYKGNNSTLYKEYVINSFDDSYLDFNQKVDLLKIPFGDRDFIERVDKSKITKEGNNGYIALYVDLPYIFSLLTKQDVSFYEIDITTYQGKKTTILSTGDIVTVNLQLSELDAVT